MRIVPRQQRDLPWIRQLLTRRWGSPLVVTRGVGHQADELPALVAWRGSEPMGLLTYRIAQEDLEVVTLDAVAQGVGVGSAPLHEIERMGRSANCRRLWLITTNDNTRAMGFYRKRGLHLIAVHSGAVAHSRTIKPQIPTHGLDGVPITDEIEFEKVLDTRNLP